ncbi:unnamed protein product, partial [Brenthis ino]
MSLKSEEVPLIAIKPETDDDELNGKWSKSETIKICLLIMFSVALYGYLYVYIKSMIIRGQELDRLAEITEDINRRLNRLFELDSNMSIALAKLREVYGVKRNT